MARSEALNSLLTLTKDGEWGTEAPIGDCVQMRVVRGTDFAAVRFGDFRKVPLRYIPRHLAERKKLVPGDVLIETAGGTKDQPTGRTLFLKESFFSSAAAPMTCASFARFLRVDGTKVEPEYLYWYLQGLYRGGQMEAHQIQHTGVARFQYTRFAETTRISLPGLEEQRAIARILGALDDKIELNRKTAETLEAMARALFKSWFVDFDPVRAKMGGRRPGTMGENTAALFPAAFALSSIGQVPSGWHVDTLDALIELRRGHDLPSTSRKSGIIPIVSSGGISGSHDIAQAKAPGIVTGRYGTLGRVFLMEEDYWPLNTTLYSSDMKNNEPTYIFYTLAQVDFAKYSDKGAVPGINRNHLHMEHVIIPPVDVQRAFGRLANEWRSAAKASESQSATLAIMRDTLLPKLMSGELRVRDAKRAVGSAT